jgi:hypothetical protein
MAGRLLYYPYRIFTLEQANLTLPSVAHLTRETQERLQALRSAYHQTEGESEGTSLEAETRALLNDWAEAILEIGAQPKGIFTVDFRSPDPNMLWCWAPDEDRISHRHFTWESFKDRTELEEGEGSWLSWN